MKKLAMGLIVLASVSTTQAQAGLVTGASALSSVSLSRAGLLNPAFFYANHHFDFQAKGTGYATLANGQAMSVPTNSVLKVTVQAGQGGSIPGTGYSVGYNCEMLTVRVGNMTQTAFVRKKSYVDFMLEYGYMSYDPCASAKDNVTLDFSAALAPGHNTATVQVSNASTDNCRLWGDVYDGGCGLSANYSTYEIEGALDVLTN